MYAAKGGHLDTIKELMKYPSLKYEVKNKVGSNRNAFTLSVVYCCTDYVLVNLITIFQKEQNVYHVVVREGRLECLKHLCTLSEDYPLLTQDIIKTACLSKDKVFQHCYMKLI